MSFHRNPCLRNLTTFAALLSLALCLSCGNNNYYGYASPAATSGFQHRILVSNAFTGSLLIINADNNTLYGRQISTSAAPQVFAEAHAGAFTLSYSNTSDTLYYIDDKLEAESGDTISLTGDVESLGILSGDTVGVTASRNAPLNGLPSGAIFILDLTNRVVTATIAVPLVRRVVLNHAGTLVLAFADNSNNAYLINTTAYTATPIPDPNGVLDHPVTAVFSSDDSTAYILSCGAECGGTQAKVTVFNPSSGTLGNTVDVEGATMGVLDNSGNLWVAGSTNNAGTLQSVNTSGLGSGTVTPSSPVSIANGYHTQMAVADDGRLYVGSSSCSNVVDPQGNPIQGCLSIYNMSSSSVITAAANGDVTGIAPVIGKHTVFVAQGGSLVIYNTASDAPLPPSSQIAIVGQAYAVLKIS